MISHEYFWWIGPGCFALKGSRYAGSAVCTREYGLAWSIQMPPKYAFFSSMPMSVPPASMYSDAQIAPEMPAPMTVISSEVGGVFGAILVAMSRRSRLSSFHSLALSSKPWA